MGEEKSVEALRAELKALQDQINPPPRPPCTHQPIDYTENASMPRAAMLEMIKAVPDALMRDLRLDNRKPNPVTQASSSPVTSTPSTQSQPVQRGSGWRDAAPLTSPPGIEYADALVDAQDRLDKAELALKLAKAGMLKEE